MANYHDDEVLVIETDLEVEIFVHFHIHPAEPDVGLMSDYAELIACFFETPLGSIMFSPSEDIDNQISEKLNSRVHESGYYDYYDPEEWYER